MNMKCSRSYSVLVLIVLIKFCCGQNLNSSDITIVDDDTRYQTTHPETILSAFDKVRHPKGSYVFTKGSRITGK